MSSRTCPEWPQLMELAPELQFKHYTVREAQLPGDALVTLEGVDLDAVAICCDLDQPRVLRRAHRSGGRRGAPRLALVRPARVGRALARRRRRLSPTRPRRPACLRRGSPTRHPGGSVRPDAVASRSLPRGEGQEPARPAPARSPGGARAARCSATSSPPAPPSGRRSSSGPPRRPRPWRSATLVADPGGGQGAAVRAGLEAAALRRGGVGPFLVVNADLPCVTARDLLALAGAVPDDGLALAPAADGTTNALALASTGLFVPVYGPGSAARFAALAPSRQVDAPNLIDDVDTIADLERLARPARARARAASSPRCAPERPHEGDRALGRRRRRAVPARRHGCSRSRQRSHHRQRGGRHRGARPPRLARPRQRPLRARRRSPTRSAAGAAPDEIVERARDRRGARRRGLVPARRPRHRPAPRPHASSCAQGVPLSGGDRAARRRRSGSGARCSRRPTTRSARSSRRRPGRSRSRSGSSRAATATRSTPSTTPAPRRRDPRRAWSRRSRAPT